MKAILVIDIADDVTEAYEDFTVDYDLRGTPKDDQKVNESIKNPFYGIVLPSLLDASRSCD